MPRLREEEVMAHSEEEGGRFYLIWVWGVKLQLKAKGRQEEQSKHNRRMDTDLE